MKKILEEEGLTLRSRVPSSGTRTLLARRTKKTKEFVVTDADVVDFVNLYWQNVHILGTTRLQRWLPESFLPFPMLFERLEAISEV